MNYIPTVGISSGDLNGIGTEITLKALKNKLIFKEFTPVLYSSVKVVNFYRDLMNVNNSDINVISDISKVKRGQLNVLNCWSDTLSLTPGKSDPAVAKFPLLSLNQMVHDHKKGSLDYVVTNPIDKSLMSKTDFGHVGHTEFFAKEYSGNARMIMSFDELRVGVLTSHIALKDVPAQITKENILSYLKDYKKILQMDFGIQEPLIAVLGLNPHCGDKGLMGKEEIDIIRPAIEEAKKIGIMAMGPYAADGFFATRQYQKFGGVLAMYHDQGLAPFKTIAESGGANLTLNLDIIRSSPDHGPAFDLAGQNKANPKSMLTALYKGLDVWRARQQYQEDEENKVEKMPKLSEKDV